MQAGRRPPPLSIGSPLPSRPPLVLALDTGSPVSSVALARADRVLAQGTVERAATSETLLALVDAVLVEAGAAPAELDAVCVLRGPGSFTGLRIGLATALGLQQALGLRAAAMPTLRVLAEAAAADRVVAAVDALRGEWFVQAFRRRTALEPEGPPELLRPEGLRVPEGAVLVGFDVGRLAAAAGLDAVRVVVPEALAPVAARLAARWPEWDPALLCAPLYLRPAPATAPGLRRAVDPT
ncbi:MAG TPA: tRNA (adenosine(37)-N6)-threonylcarbamoyltransferase complex dimerization subunit type 1 TsaB [Thermoanaerobaculia bacterium]|nr:tRNA (adenosine(37)-N6)-threonylcarbamoyltransferase complex dimerization subunit type 1 TsaB [Thermoanaerobaculia bacterium]